MSDQEHGALPSPRSFHCNVAGLKARPLWTMSRDYAVTAAMYPDDRIGFYNSGRPDTPDFRAAWVRCGDFCRVATAAS